MAVRKTEKGASLRRWFKEEWKDEKGNECGSTKNKNTKDVDFGFQLKVVYFLGSNPLW